ncbi:(2E,6E)-farnesyl diphosphate synthase [Carnimonas nigrificans]|uniref:(2E,6E)-farnesyl diphosphate synthase n=1 Tax=Carnimonas nigrificans TaxID=64323 RepID=UPI000471C81D|nr:farnesyl diphosphate synthase [Carnimonas nigrificans]
MSEQTLVNEARQRVNTVLEGAFSATPGAEAKLDEAMRYAVMGGGKRLRPTLAYATGKVLGIEAQRIDAGAAAVELIHAYSLVHDDLPAMDDDDLRRGRPTVHRAFDEATAVLAGDALQTLAFELLATSSEPRAAALVAALARASGRNGMAGGQALDLAAVGQSISLEQLIRIHRHKTGALIIAAIEMAALLELQEGDERLDALRRYGAAIGLAFQIHDDVLDVVGDTDVIGKHQGADAEHNKPTYPVLLGLEQAAQRAASLVDEACEALSVFGDAAEPLQTLARYMVSRDH